MDGVDIQAQILELLQLGSPFAQLWQLARAQLAQGCRRETFLAELEGVRAIWIVLRAGAAPI
jgi:hypothetical protein